MDLQALFEHKGVKKKTHIVMKSVGKEQAGSFKGWIHPPKFDGEGNPAHEVFPVKNRKAMEDQGWQKVEQVAEPKAAATKKTKDVE